MLDVFEFVEFVAVILVDDAHSGAGPGGQCPQVLELVSACAI
jgi:hypothetical protein